jgi:hypothetical protein
MRKGSDWHVHSCAVLLRAWRSTKQTCGLLAQGREDQLDLVLMVVGLSWAHVIELSMSMAHHGSRADRLWLNHTSRSPFHLPIE